MKKENLEAVAKEAHRLGMTLTGHVPEGMNAFDAVNAGQDQINHVSYILDIMDPDFSRLRHESNRQAAFENIKKFTGHSPDADKAIAFLREHHTVVDPTLALYETFMRTGTTPLAQFGLVPRSRSAARRSAQESVRQYQRRGLREAIFPLTEMRRRAAPRRHSVVVGTDQAFPGTACIARWSYTSKPASPHGGSASCTIVPLAPWA
jgi:hypothetical protein